MSDVHQCPYCELRFVARTELEDHIALDHPDVREDDVDDDTLRRDRGERPGP